MVLALARAALLPNELKANRLEDEFGGQPNQLVLGQELKNARSKRKLVLFAQLHALPGGPECLHANDARGRRYCVPLEQPIIEPGHVQAALAQLQAHIGKNVAVFPHGRLVALCRAGAALPWVSLLAYPPVWDLSNQTPRASKSKTVAPQLQRLEAESIHILREAVAEADNPVMLYSACKDSSVMLHLARKAFYPAPPPLPLLHVDTRWQFQEAYRFRDQMARASGMNLLVHVNPDAIAKAINPFDHSPALHTDITETEGLKQALDQHKFDVVLCTTSHRCDPKNQRPEPRNLFHTRIAPGESSRVFPLCNWTELDIWQYIHQEGIAVVPLYFAKERPVVLRDGMIIMVDDDRCRLLPGEKIQSRKVRFQALGCYPLTGAVDSEAQNPQDIILELVNARSPEDPTIDAFPQERQQSASRLVFPVQWVNRPNASFRGFSGNVAQGKVTVGDEIRVTRSGQTATVAEIVTMDGPLPQAVTGDAVTLRLSQEVDVARGDVLSLAQHPLEMTDQFEATLEWMVEEAGLIGRSYDIKLASQWAAASITTIKYRVDTNTLAHEASRQLTLNDIGVCNLALSKPLVFDSYAQSNTLGGFILVDRYSHATVATGMIRHSLRRAQNVHRQALSVTRQNREKLNAHPGKVIWFTGLSGSGKSTLANALEVALNAQGKRTYLLDGDNVRQGLNKDLGFTDADRVENIRRIAEVAKLMLDAGLIVLTAFISPFRQEREMARALIGPENFVEVYVSTSLAVCEQRDAKGLYKKARSGQLPNMSGISSPYEAPLAPQIELNGGAASIEESASDLQRQLLLLATSG